MASEQLVKARTKSINICCRCDLLVLAPRLFMRVMHSPSHLRDEFRRLSDRHRRAPDYFVKLTAFDESHAEVAGAIAFAHFVNRNDVRMIQVGGGFRFPAKALQVSFARPMTKADYL